VDNFGEIYLYMTVSKWTILKQRNKIKLRNKSWKPECVLSFNMGWRIKFTNIRQPMLNLKTHSGFHELFRFWYVYKYGSILWLEDGNLYLRLRTMSHTIYAAKFEQTIIHQHVQMRRENQSHIHLRRESQSYWWSICNNNSVFACFNCTSHIINFGYVDYFQCI
jgi:hypothetical protein